MASTTNNTMDLLARGWERTRDGRLWHPIIRRFRSDQDADRLHRLRVMQSDQADDLIDELIDCGAIGLSAATPEQLASAKTLLARIPAAIRRAVFRRGRVRITRGYHVADAHGRQFAGLTNYLSAVVAGDHQDAEATFLHELAHVLDNAKGWQAISNGEAWRTIWHTDKAAGKVSPFAGQNREPCEYFAESFAKYFVGDKARAELPASVQRFMANLEDAQC